MTIQKAFGYEQKEIEVRGTKYTVQNMPFKLFYEMQERCRDKNGNMLPTKMYDEIFDKVIIAPKVSWDNFTTVDEIEELMQEIISFLGGEKPVKEQD